MKVFQFSIAVAMLLACLCLTSCGGKPSATVKEIPQDAFQNSQTGVQLSLGMTYEQVEALSLDKRPQPELQEPDEPDVPENSGTQVYGTTPEETITVYYDRGIVRGLSVDDTLATGGTSHWNMTGGVTMGSSLEDIQACYGSNSGATGEDGKVSLSYGFGNDGQKAANPHDVTLMTAFVVGENGAEICALLSGILLGV